MNFFCSYIYNSKYFLYPPMQTIKMQQTTMKIQTQMKVHTKVLYIMYLGFFIQTFITPNICCISKNTMYHTSYRQLSQCSYSQLPQCSKRQIIKNVQLHSAFTLPADNNKFFCCSTSIVTENVSYPVPLYCN